MDGATRQEMEHHFGVDFGEVAIHEDADALAMTKDLSAQAFTNGKDIYFNKDKYDPNSKEGKHLLAHELTHTIQQGAVAKGSSPQVQTKGNPSTPPPVERPNKDKNSLEKYKTAFPYFYTYMTKHFGKYLNGSERIKKTLLKYSVGGPNTRGYCRGDQVYGRQRPQNRVGNLQ